MPARFEPTFESLSQYARPDWFRDAKFGIWAHWGPQSVPMYGDWYARHMYAQGHPQNLYHVRHYGHPSKFGYKDICRLWNAAPDVMTSGKLFPVSRRHDIVSVPENLEA